MKYFIPCFFVLLGIVFLTVLWSGYQYQYNGDELIHAQNAYFLLHGLRPFRDYFSIYTPIFDALMAPTVWFFGSTLQTIRAMRIEAVGLYILGLAASFGFLQKLYGKRVAIVFLGLILLDPFTTFAGMQIRPDTLMLTLFIFGLWALVYDREVLAGLLIGLSTLTAIKIAPAILPVGIYLLYTRKYKSILAILVPWVLFIGYFSALGLFRPMLTQLILDVKYLSESVQNPTRFGFFYLPDNAYIYGVAGKPLTWWYVCILPVLALSGAVIRKKGMLHVVLTAGAIFTFIGLLIPTTAFIQYYVPLSWFLTILAAVFFVFVWDHVARSFKFIALCVGFVVFVCVALSAIRANIARAQMTSAPIEVLLTKYWRIVPVSEPVFPSWVFRPIVYPIAGYTMGDVPEVIRKQFIVPEVALEKSRLNYILLSDYGINQFDPSTQDYIRSHFHRVAGDTELMIRNSEVR